MWRAVPRDLSLRVKRYYEHYYTKRAVFDEATILGALNPQLHQELVQHILSKTLGRVPLFARLSPDFALAIFPLLKPLSVSPRYPARGRARHVDVAAAADVPS